MTREELEKYVKDNYSAEPDYPWIKYPDYEVFRHTSNKKWFALIMEKKNWKNTSLKTLIAITNLAPRKMMGIFISEKAVSQAKPIERCYISDNEREYYKNIRLEDSKLGDNKVKLARRQYRGKGLYIDEILV